MNTCPHCNKKIGFAGLERTGNYADNKKWYQIAKHELCCPHCQMILQEVNQRPKAGFFAVLVLLIANILFAISGNGENLRDLIILCYVLGMSLFIFYLFGFRYESRKEN